MRAIDLFAGAGGFTTGAVDAGVSVVWAANHWQLAVDAHATAHPDAEHVCQDLQQADWSKVPAHDLLLASPCCQGHSKARGKDTPQHDASRSTAWAVVSAAEFHRPEHVVVENVPEFLDWSLFPSWADAMARLGYTLEPHILDAADVGVPQNRVRLFLVGSLSGRVRLPTPTRDHVPVRDVLDIPSGSWSDVYKPGRAEATISRHEAGKANIGTRFYLCPFYGRGSGKTGRSLDRPCGTLTTKARWALHDGLHDRMRMLTTAETLAIAGFPADYLDPSVTWTQANHLIGNAVAPPVARYICENLVSA